MTAPQTPEGIAADIEAGLKELATSGVDIPSTLLHLKVDLLIELLWPQGGTLRHAFDTNFQQNLVGVVEQGRAAAARKTLLEGVHGADGTPNLPKP